ncbi:MAG: hypothetical protein H0U57_08905 [Tatlockia sp.]|nr:hypothetical protein [Tatlockia sp.]
MTIRILSFDFDGCLFHQDYFRSLDKDVIKHNRVMLENLIKENVVFEDLITIIGSTRQSLETDNANATVGNKGSCFPAIQQISKYLNANFDPFLLADTFGDLPEGTSFNRAINPDNDEPHSRWLYDESKLTILYAQMHHFACKFPNKDMIFDFIDDRSLNQNDELNILQDLNTYFSRYPQMIPPNITLRLHHYQGKDMTPIALIKGDSNGFIDENYAETIKEIANLAKDNSQADGLTKALHTIKHAIPEVLKSRSPLIVESAEQKKSLFYLKKNLEEMRTGENNLSANGQLVIDALEQVDSSDFSREEIDLFNDAKYHFAVIAKEKKFWDSIIPLDLENINYQELSNIFVQLSQLLENPEHHEPIHERLSSCGWATNNYIALSKLLAKNKNNMGKIDRYLRNNNQNLPIDALIITPFQRLPRLALFSCDWVKALDCFTDSFSGKKAATSFKRKFKRILSSLNQVSKVIEEQNKQKEKHPVTLAESFFDLFKTESKSNGTFQAYIDPQALLSKKIKQDLIQSFMQLQEEADSQDDLEDNREELVNIEHQLAELSLSFIQNAESSTYDFTLATANLAEEFRKLDEEKKTGFSSSFFVEESNSTINLANSYLDSSSDKKPKEKLKELDKTNATMSEKKIPLKTTETNIIKEPQHPSPQKIARNSIKENTLSKTPESSMQKIIAKAALEGIKNYLDWSEKRVRNRGTNGWFTRLRHGQEGRDRARELSSKLGADSPLLETQSVINTFLNNPYTRFNNHSLASYLLDSLTAIENSPWHDTSRYPEYSPFDGEEEKGCCSCF